MAGRGGRGRQKPNCKRCRRCIIRARDLLSPATGLDSIMLRSKSHQACVKRGHKISKAMIMMIGLLLRLSTFVGFVSTANGTALNIPHFRNHAVVIPPLPVPFICDTTSKITTSVQEALRSSQSLLKKKLKEMIPGADTSKFDQMIHELFESAETKNRDGTITLEECYTLVLRIYIQWNQKAPTPPPSRAAIRNIYRSYDWNHRRLYRQEFTQLARILQRRALVRSLSHQISTVVLAPLLAQATVQQLKQKLPRLPSLAKAVVPPPLHARCLPILTSEQFGTTVLVTFFVSTLGDVVVRTVNLALQLALPQEEKEKTT